MRYLPPAQPGWYSVSQAAVLLSTGKKTIKGMIGRGEIRGKQDQGEEYASAADIDPLARLAHEYSLKTKNVARLLHLSGSRVQKLASEGHLPTIKIGRTLRFRSSDVENFLDKCQRFNLTIADASRRFHIPRSIVEEWIADGRLQTFQPGKKLWVEARQVRLLSRQR